MTEKELDRIDKALLLARQRAIECIKHGQPATIVFELILKAGGKVGAAVVVVRENVKME